MKPKVIIITFNNDWDMIILYKKLKSKGISTSLFIFDGYDNEYSVDATSVNFKLHYKDQELSSETIKSASVIIYRTNLANANAPVISTQGTAKERQFATSEWGALLKGLLLVAEQRYSKCIWINKPSVSILANEKYPLIATADLHGFQIPRYRISTENILPESRTKQWVCKAINQNESIDEKRTFPTAKLSKYVIDKIPFRSECPSLIQEQIEPDHELRIYYLLGNLLCLKIKSKSTEYTDMRFLRSDSFVIKEIEVPKKIKARLIQFCRKKNFLYCAFDFLALRNGELLLIDVNHMGTWSYFETSSNPNISKWYTETLNREIFNKV
jgi:hypothetical protein